MTDTSDPRFEPADYRVRLFLSVDLSGSTAFKNSSAGEETSTDSAPRWVTVFQQFYADFPARFASEFQKQANGSVGQDGCPKLWKAVGDELVFCGRISNQKACTVALNAFIGTLHIYRKKLLDEGINLNVKGAGWLAAFPEPNRTVKLRTVQGDPDLISASEALEASADRAPFDYDFLGKGIDTGFRVAGGATPERFILSVQLARLISGVGPEMGFGHDIRFDRPATLKGVNKNEPYPKLYIDTMLHLPTKAARLLEREVLRESQRPDPERLVAYLDAYCAFVGTDNIMLKLDADAEAIDPPESYMMHKQKIADHLLNEKGREFNGEDDDTQPEPIDDVELATIDDVELEPLQNDAGPDEH